MFIIREHQIARMRELTATPEKAAEMLTRAGIRPYGDFAQKLRTIIDEAEDGEQHTVQLTERERAQMHLPFVLSRLKDIPQDKRNQLIDSEHEQQVVEAWPNERLSDEDYEDLLEVIQDLEEEMLMFMLIDDDDMDAVIDDAIERVQED